MTGRFNILVGLLVGCALMLYDIQVRSGCNDAISREEICERASEGVGYGYWWGHGRWRSDGNYPGWCEGNCGNCTFYSRNDAGQRVTCTSFNQSYCYGADCSGYVAKCWDVGSQKAITFDEHPYVAANFAGNGACWRVIQRSELQPGDALGSAHHVVLYDGAGSNGQYWVYEARGCAYGIVHRQRSCSGYTPVRRNNLQERPPCDPAACSGHGRQVNGVCVCDKGFAGPACDRCAPGYVEYPICRPEDSQNTCTTVSEIKCGQTIHGDTRSGQGKMVNYKPYCGTWEEKGKEVVYKFSATNLSRVTATLSNQTGSTDVDLMVMADICNNNSCVEYGDDTAYFDAQPGRDYYIAVDGFAGEEGSFSLSLTCQDRAWGKWIGDPCTSDSECVYHDPKAGDIQLQCYTRNAAKFCSMPCSKYCPDKPNKAATFCTADPLNANQGMCVSKADTKYNGCCGFIPGTDVTKRQRFRGSDSAWVCYPK